MKKLLLSLATFAAAVSLSAQDAPFGAWTKSIEPVSSEQATDLQGLHTAVSADGSVYASMTYNKTLTFAGKNLPDTDGMLSSLVVKYAADGTEQWAASFVGAAVVTAMTTDTEGNLYVAGAHTDAVTLQPAAGDAATIDGNAVSFIAKFTADGKVAALKTLHAEADAELLESGMYFPENLYVTVNSLKCHGNTLFASVSFNANVPELGWQASYLNVFDFMYMENRSKGIFATDCATLANTQSVLTVQNTEHISYDQFYPEALAFDIDANGLLHYAFIGFGNLTAATPAAQKAFSFAITTDDSGNKEYALVTGTVANLEQSKVYEADMHSAYAQYDIADMAVADGKICLGGTFYGNFWFDRTITKEFSTTFSAEILGDGSAQAFCGDEADECTAYGLEGSDIILSSTKGTNRLNGNKKEQISTLSLDGLGRHLTAANSYILHDGSIVQICGRYNADEAAQIATCIKPLASAAAQKVVRYNLAGEQVGEGYKGIVIEGGVKKLAK